MTGYAVPVKIHMHNKYVIIALSDIRLFYRNVPLYGWPAPGQAGPDLPRGQARCTHMAGYLVCPYGMVSDMP